VRPTTAPDVPLGSIRCRRSVIRFRPSDDAHASKQSGAGTDAEAGVTSGVIEHLAARRGDLLAVITVEFDPARRAYGTRE
jgi:hypothetical protein